jgi:hypothetical protein
MRFTIVALTMLLFMAVPTQSRELAYDDGTAERSIVWEVAGNGVAVRFSVRPGTVLEGARVWVGFAASQNPLGICVLRANGLGGAPGDTLIGYFNQSLYGTRMAFADVAFPIEPIVQDTDFYIVSLQTRPASGDATSVGLDTSSPPDGRSWLFENGVWSVLPTERGDVMIRAIVFDDVPVASGTWAGIKLLYKEP